MAKPRNSNYPIGRLIVRLWNESGLSLPAFLAGLGYKNTDKAIKRFDHWVQHGFGDRHFIDSIKACYPHLLPEIAQELQQTEEILKVEVQRYEDEHTAYLRARFVPYIEAIPEENRPRSISLYAVTGGNRRQKSALPLDILDRSEVERLAIVKGLIEAHMLKSQGRTLFQGKILFYQAFWSFGAAPTKFTTDGVLVGEDIDRSPGNATLTIAGGEPFP